MRYDYPAQCKKLGKKGRKTALASVYHCFNSSTLYMLWIAGASVNSYNKDQLAPAWLKGNDSSRSLA